MISLTHRPTSLIFDMDGTLIDNMPFHNRVWMEYLAELGAQPDPARFHEQTAGKTNPEILRLFLGADLAEEQMLRYSTEKEMRYRAAYQQAMQPIPGALEFLARARQAGLRLGLATSAGRENIAFVLGRLGLEHTFDAILSAEDVTRGKPDPQIFQLAAARLGADPADCLVFEDSPKGVEAARRAGMPVVVILTGMRAEEALKMEGVLAAVTDYVQIEGIWERG